MDFEASLRSVQLRRQLNQQTRVRYRSAATRRRELRERLLTVLAAVAVLLALILYQ